MIEVTPREAERFQQTWQALRTRPGSFSLVGFNCASHAALAFAIAGLVGREIPGLDTPDNLFQALWSRNRARCRDEYGLLGFLPRESAPDEMTLQCDVGLDGTRPVPSGPTPPRRGSSVGDGFNPAPQRSTTI